MLLASYSFKLILLFFGILLIYFVQFKYKNIYNEINYITTQVEQLYDKEQEARISFLNDLILYF